MLYTREEVSKHNTLHDCWLIAHNSVYNVTGFLQLHPEHMVRIINKAGKDVTFDYDFHTSSQRKIWNKYKIGYVQRDMCIFL